MPKSSVAMVMFLCLFIELKLGGAILDQNMAKDCKYKGKTYSEGASFKDNCNMCFCLTNSEVICTTRSCPKGCPGPKGKLIKIGETYAPDSCNMCGCTDFGMTVCTVVQCQK